MAEMTEGELSGKVALVTGAARGIGRAIALRLAEAGSAVALNDLPESLSLGEELGAEIDRAGGRATLALGNVAEGAEMKTAVGSVLAEWAKIDILVNNAGIASARSFLRISDSGWDKLLRMDLKGAFLCCRLVLPSMIGARWGRIINLCSVTGLVGSLGRADYAASKGGLIALTRSLAMEVGSRNITVNAIAPGFIQTRLTDEL